MHPTCLAQLAATPGRALGRLAQWLQAALERHGLSNPYRPERHYMRGRGPKWHEKHRDQTARPRR